ncbi:hypothetical protein HELRODRAFT_166914 [Helobdella robusta]|uniref:Immunoglobulin I-set domain-containing protein n=1 Tax=Helobdella robusta TaxID=6412 RepID=T1EYQ8_HELRO|nr:hypothetical protein HELRODRAFT_166914 [Helobdella robusta]ESO11843.1 hypothetical protein HELRODRAFT_166914 [Helobdella robusta]
MPLVSGGRIQIDENEDESFILSIDNVNEDDSGCYQCTVSNEFGQSNSLAALIVNGGTRPCHLKCTYIAGHWNRQEHRTANLARKLARFNIDVVALNEIRFFAFTHFYSAELIDHFLKEQEFTENKIVQYNAGEQKKAARQSKYLELNKRLTKILPTNI